MTTRKELCFYMSLEWTFRKITSHLLLMRKVLDDCFIPKANVPFERPLFQQIVQESQETVD